MKKIKINNEILLHNNLGETERYNSDNSYRYSENFKKLVEYIHNQKYENRKLPNGSSFFTSKMYKFDFGKYGSNGVIDSVFVESEYGSIIHFIEDGENGIEIINFQFSNLVEPFNDIVSFYKDLIYLVGFFFDSSVSIGITLNSNMNISVDQPPSFQGMIEILKNLGFFVSYLNEEEEFSFLNFVHINEYDSVDFRDDSYEKPHHRELPLPEDDDLPF